MTCPSRDEIIGFVDGELALNRHREVEAHLGGCDRCAARRDGMESIVARMRPDEDEHDNPALVAEIMQGVRAGRAPAPLRPAWRRRAPRVAAAVVALAAAAVAAVVIVPRLGRPPAPGSSGFIARGGTASKPERWISLWVLARVAAGRYAEVKQPINNDARLVFGYRNLDPARAAGADGAAGSSATTAPYRYLMIFAVDGAGRVYWYYPAYERKGEDPKSIVIQAGKHQLDHEVQHDFKPGPLRVFAVFSRRVLRVLAVEKIVGRALRSVAGGAGGGGGVRALRRLPIAGTGQLTRLLTVRAGR